MSTLCRTTLNYAPRDPSLGRAAGRVEVEIRDARTADLPGWKECGFELVCHTSAVRDWTDDTGIATVHYPEMEQVAQRLTGCDFALLSDHVKRTPEQSRRPREQSPVYLVHSDFADDYADAVRASYRNVHGRGAAALARNDVAADDVGGAGRVLMLQFWRNIGPAKMDYPLAFCDARTVRRNQARPFRYTGYAAGGVTFDALAIVAPERPSDHEWYAFPELTPDEVVAFRTYDTDLVGAGSTYFTPHSAFRDPDVEVGKPARHSIELRVACLFS